MTTVPCFFIDPGCFKIIIEAIGNAKDQRYISSRYSETLQVKSLA